MIETTKKILLGVLVLPLVLLAVDSVEPEKEYTDTTVLGKEEVVEPTPEPEPIPEPEPEAPKVWVCEDCTENEKTVLKFLQEKGIKDKYALAVLMGNIKQESLFHPNICEGGARVPYNRCYRGGYGLIQWTTDKRYYGLGQFVKRWGGDPSTLDTQLRYMVVETEWRNVEHIFKTPGLSQDKYMNAAYQWLRWGIHGARTTYSNQYLNRLTQV